MKVWSKGKLVLVITAAAAGWMVGTATEPARRDDPMVHSVVGARDEMAENRPNDLMPSGTGMTEASTPRVLMVARAERAGVSDLDRLSSELIESHRGKPMFGEWSMKYLVVDDALRADVDRDEWLTGQDFAVFFGWLERGDSCADLSGDGMIDGVDVDVFLRAFASQELVDVRRDATSAC